MKEIRMKKTFLLQHIHRLNKNDEDVKVIGIYSSLAKAKIAIKKLSKQPGFKKNIPGFHIDEYELDRDYWAEGYITK